MDEEHMNGCGCGCEHDCSEEEEMSTEDLVDENHIILHSLIELLKRKNIITEDELEKMMDEFESDDEEDDAEEADEE